MNSSAMQKTAAMLVVAILAVPLEAEDVGSEIDLVKMHAPILTFHPEEGEQCCYPSDAEEAFRRLVRDGELGEVREPKVLDPNAPCYYQIWQCSRCRLCAETRIKYWFWYNFNDFPQCPAVAGSHPGDWESVEVVLQGSEVYQYMLSNHEGCIHVWPQNAILESGHIKVWVGNGSHANYPSPNYDPICYDEIADGPAVWHTMNNLKSIPDSIFANYRGSWGNPVSPVARQFENIVPEEDYLLLWPFSEDWSVCNQVYEGGHRIAFLAGVKMTATCPDGGCLRILGEPTASTLMLSYTKWDRSDLKPRIHICDGAIKLCNNGSIVLY